METFFEHNPTKEEISQLIGNLSKEDYLKELEHAPAGENILFITLLYELRHDEYNSKKYRNQILELYQQWVWGLDDVSIVS